MDDAAPAPTALGAPRTVATPVHGGTDDGPQPIADFSTNGNPLGPEPGLAAALMEVEVDRYPDPAYRGLREALGRAHGVDPDCVVVGTGATELIHRVVRACPGAVAAVTPGFGAYAHAAAVSDRPLVPAALGKPLLRAAVAAAVTFVASPSSPDGRVVPASLLEELVAAASPGALVLDLAYAPLAQVPTRIPTGAWALYAPNKSLGATGIRAGYVVAPSAASAAALQAVAPSWPVSVHGVAFLRRAASTPARAWVAATAPTLWAWRRRLCHGLERLGIEVTRSDATFLLARLGRPTADDVAAWLRRHHGLKVRPATSFGLPDALRLAALPPASQDLLLTALEDPRCPR